MALLETIVHPGSHGNAEPTRFGYRTAEHRRLNAAQNIVSAVCAWIAGAATVALTVLTVVSVISREAFSSPMGWSVSATEKYLLPMIAFFGMVTAYRTSSHIAVTSLFEHFAPRVRKAVLVLIHITVLVCLIVLLIGTTRMTSDAMVYNFHILAGSADLATADWTWRIIAPFASAAGIVVVAIDLYRELVTSWHRPYTDYEPGLEGQEATA